jgi:hypothetical protein
MLLPGWQPFRCRLTLMLWGKRELERQLADALFERTVLSPAKLSPAVTELHPAAADVFKDTYLLDFLDLPPTHSEADLQRALVDQRAALRHQGPRSRQVCPEPGCFTGSGCRVPDPATR